MGTVSSYYNLDNFRNTLYALNTTLETHYANLLLEGDATRILYTDNSMALRERAQDQDWNTLYLPFMNYKIKSVTGQTNRNWWNHYGNISGVYVPELERKIKYTPVRVSYESTLFLHRDDSMQYITTLILGDDSNETLLRPVVSIDGEELELLAVLSYNFDHEPEFQEKDWLTQNNIHSVTLDFEFDYQIITENTDNFCIPETFLFEWGRLHNDGNILDNTYEYMIDRFSETVTEAT